MTPNLTDAGKNLLLRALAGETITFTKIKIGNGFAQEANTAVDLMNPLLTVELSKITIGDEYVTLTAAFTNSGIINGFRITEAGFYAKDPNNDAQEILYAIGNEDESAADYVPDNTNRILEMEFHAHIFIGNAQNVSAAINSSLVYASKADFEAHTGNESNPHKVTKQQVGLGNVPNVSTNDQTPTFTEATTMANINSGERASTIFGKIKLAIKNLILHISNNANPHHVTASQVGAAARAHTHSAADFNQGVLPIVRGGTGVTSINGLAQKLYVIGHYEGDVTHDRVISVGFTPSAILVLSHYGKSWLALKGQNATYDTREQFPNNTWDTQSSCLGIVTNGFRVNCVSLKEGTNDQEVIYHYIAFR